MRQFLLALQVLIICLGLSIDMHAQPAIEWDKTFGGEHSDRAPIIRSCADGGYIAGGMSVSEIGGDKSQSSRGDGDYWVVKFSKDGTKQWDKRFGGPKTDQLTALIQTTDGGFLIGGISWSGQGGDKSDTLIGGTDLWVVKINASGTKEWDKTYGGMGSDALRSISQTRDGGFIIGANSNTDGGDLSIPRSFKYFWMIKVTATGDVLWDKSLGNENYGVLRYADETPDLGYIIAGESYAGPNQYKSEAGYGSTDYWVLKLDSSLNRVWDKTIGGPDMDNLRQVEPMSDGGYILGGNSTSSIGGLKSENSRGYVDYWVVKLSADGKVQWDKTLGGSLDEELFGIRETYDGNFIVAGSSESLASGDKSENTYGSNYWSVKLSKSGTKLWDKTISTGDNSKLSSIEYVPDGGYVLAGDSFGDKSGDKSENSRGNEDYWIVKLQSDETPKPFRLSYFKAQKAATQVDLVWETKTERGSDRFEVQHSLDKSAWQVLSSVNAKDTSYLRSRYQYVHANPASVKHYYRLRMTASDGKRTYSAIDSADYTPPAPWVSPYVIAWDKTLGGADIEYLHSVAQTSDGGFILGGQSRENSGANGDRTEPSRGGPDYWLVKLSADGQKEWDKTYGGDANDILESVQQTADGGYILGGISYSPASGDKSEGNGGSDNSEDRQPDFWIIKTSSTGAIEWEKTIMRLGEELLTNIRVTKDGGYLAWGAYFMVKLSAGGKLEWERNDVYDVVMDWSGNFEQADGSFYVLDGIRGGFQVSKLQANGSRGADWNYIGSESSTYNFYDFRFARVTTDGGIIMVATTESSVYGDKTEPSRGGKDTWVIKVAADGTKQWDKTFGGSGDDTRGTLAPTSDGGYMVSIESDSPVSGDKSEGNNGLRDAWLIKITADGTKQWDKTFGGSKYIWRDPYYDGTSTLGLLEERPDGYIVSGSSTGKSSEDKTSDTPGAWTLKLALDGTKIWDKTFEGPSGLRKAFNGGYYTSTSSAANAGRVKTENSRGGTDYWIVRITSIDDENSLPVTLTSFTAQKESATILLTWQTTSETRSDRFEVEHSLNGKTWEHIASVNAVGENNGLHKYQFVHQNPASGNNYYRLKMVDTDALFTYSKMEHIIFRLGVEVSVYPNPAAESIHVDAQDWSKVKDVKILNSQGKTLFKSVSKSANLISVKAFEPGIYFIKMTLTDGTATTRKIVIGQ